MVQRWSNTHTHTRHTITSARENREREREVQREREIVCVLRVKHFREVCGSDDNNAFRLRESINVRKIGRATKRQQ